MQCLLLVAHGSRRDESNEEIRRLTRKVAGKAESRFSRISCAFLEFADPSIPQGLQECIDAGAEKVVVVPYFLSAGRHVTEDIPAEVDKKRREHPHVRIGITECIGSCGGIADMLLKLAE